MRYTRDSGAREKCVLSIPVEPYDSKVKLLKQFGRLLFNMIFRKFSPHYQLFNKHFKVSVSFSAGKNTNSWVFFPNIRSSPVGIQDLKKEMLCKCLHMERQSFPSSFPYFSYKCTLFMPGTEPLSCNMVLPGGTASLTQEGPLKQGVNLFSHLCS